MPPKERGGAEWAQHVRVQRWTRKLRGDSDVSAARLRCCTCDVGLTSAAPPRLGRFRPRLLCISPFRRAVCVAVRVCICVSLAAPTALPRPSLLTPHESQLPYYHWHWQDITFSPNRHHAQAWRAGAECWIVSIRRHLRAPQAAKKIRILAPCHSTAPPLHQCLALLAEGSHTGARGHWYRATRGRGAARCPWVWMKQLVCHSLSCRTWMSWLT